MDVARAHGAQGAQGHGGHTSAHDKLTSATPSMSFAEPAALAALDAYLRLELGSGLAALDPHLWDFTVLLWGRLSEHSPESGPYSSNVTFWTRGGCPSASWPWSTAAKSMCTRGQHSDPSFVPLSHKEAPLKLQHVSPSALSPQYFRSLHVARALLPRWCCTAG